MAAPGGHDPARPDPAKPAIRPNDLRPRVISGVVLACGAVGSALAGGWLFAGVWAALSVLVYLEWFSMARQEPGEATVSGFHWSVVPGVALLAFLALALAGGLLAGWSFRAALPWLAGLFVAFLVAVSRAGLTHRRWQASGMLYAGGLLVSVLVLRLSDQLGLVAILALFAIVWGADIGAYFTGRALGGPKLAPRISPNKTWSGFSGGVTAGIIAGMLVLRIAGLPFSLPLVALCGALALVSVAGDLFESHMKRRFGVKDSGHLIPGHGGFMDRLDAFLFAAILAAWIGLARGGVQNAAGGLLAGW
jgi:phosphatidate cytidylyltransferase